MNDENEEQEEEGASFAIRRAAPRTRFTYTANGRQVVLRANARGYVRPRSQQEVALLDSFGLPVASPRKGGQ